MNKSEAIKATKLGAIIACISAVVLLMTVLFAIYTDAEGRLAPWNSPLLFIEVGVILVFAFGMYKKSRVASVLNFIYTIVDRVMVAYDIGPTAGFGIGFVISIFILYFYGKAILGSFVFHKFEGEENPDYKTTPKWAYICGIPAALLLVIILGFGLMSATGVIPSTKVQSYGKIGKNDILTLSRNGIISSEDIVSHFYSGGWISILDSGNILTQDRVISYVRDTNEELLVYEIPVKEISEVILESQGGAFNDSVYKVTTKNPDRWLNLILSVEEKGDQKFIQALRKKLSR